MAATPGDKLCWSVVLGLAAALAGPACAPEGHQGAPLALLREHFPQHADRVLGAPRGAGLMPAPDGQGFIPTPPPGADPVNAAAAALAARRGLRARFPTRGEDPIRFGLPDGLEVEVREVGLAGPGRLEGTGLVYSREPRRASVWTAPQTGFEEWLIIAPSDSGPLARWEVRGGALRQRGAAVEVLDASGRARLKVTAPAAYGEGGAPVAVALATDGARIVLTLAGAGAGRRHGTPLLIDPLWEATSDLATARSGHSATLLPSGQVLIAGGWTSGGPAVALDSAVVYDPTTGTFTPTAGPLATARRSHAATLLPSGKVLVTGGRSFNGPTPVVDAAELYDPATRTFASTAGPQVTARWDHTATLLPTGDVLLAGGCARSSCDAGLGVAELYHPATSTFAAASGPLGTGRWQHTATLLPSGLVLIAGGNVDHLTQTASLELYDPGAGTFATVTAGLATARRQHTATLLPTGEVLIAGGFNSPSISVVASAEVYDPIGGTVTPTTGPLATARVQHTATLLPSGEVLLAGGGDPNLTEGSVELYAAGPRTFTTSAYALATARYEHTATLLPSGHVLVVGGSAHNVYPNALQTAEVLDPGDSGFAATAAPLATARRQHAATLLATGDVLVTGGCQGNDCATVLATAELYQPAVGAIAAAGPLLSARVYHSSTLLPSGQVLVVGGFTDPSAGTTDATAELYDPGTRTFTATAGRLATARGFHSASLLPSGMVLVTGGFSLTDGAIATAELYDPASGSFAPAGRLATGRMAHTATLLPTGEVLLAGGANTGEIPQSSAELYDPAAGTFATTPGNLATARYEHSATLLPSGKVLLIGGTDRFSNLRSVETFDPATGQFAPTPGGPLPTARRYHSATLLPSGRVLIAGGDGSGVADTLSSALIYHPLGGAFATTSASLATGRQYHTATLLPSGQVLLAGGHRAAGATHEELASLELFTEAVVGSPSWAPTLDGPLPAASPGASLPISGTRFAGIAEATGGGTLTSATNFPLLRLRRLDNEATLYAPTSGWTPPPAISPPGTTATAALPTTVTPGRHLAWIVVNGIASNGRMLTIDGLSHGSACSQSLSCASGRCADGVCCDSTCTAACRACDLAGHVGTCTARPRGEQDPVTCLGDNFCDGAGACLAKAAAGATCTVDGECTSGFCVDGRCCNSRCTATCQACDVAGYLGTCRAVPLGEQDLDTCVGASYCDGASACVARQANGATCTVAGECASAYCVDGRCCNATCAAVCEACNVPGSLGTCSVVPLGQQDPGTCTGSNYCNGAGTCVAKQPQGAPCAADGECASGHCTDGYCCDTGCSATCRACDVPGSLGTCAYVPLGQRDPLLCTGGSYCSGAGACLAQLGNGSACTVAGECLSGYCAQGRCCDHACAAPCQACDLVGMVGSCTSLPFGETLPGRCDGTFTCNGAGDCRLANGQECANDSACASDHCVDGVCCDGACDGNCVYCRHPGREGTCLAVADGADPRRACQAAVGGHRSCDGSCQAGQCAFPDTGTGCGTCSACDGTGRCTEVPDDDAACGTIDCSGLDTACRSYQSLTASRCLTLGVCKTANDPSTCTQFSQLPCADGGSTQQDAGDGQPGQDGGTTGTKSGGCRAAASSAPSSGLLAMLAATLAVTRGRRRSGR